MPGLDPVLEEKWRRGPVRALVRHLEGRTTLHGSAVALAGRAVVFLGESGAGKSTCAADLCGRLDAELLADDTVEVETDRGTLVVRPSEASHWLLRDAAEALGHARPEGWKGPVDAVHVATHALPIAALISLTFGPEGLPPALTPLRGLAAFAAINTSFVRFVFDDPAVAVRDLDAIAALVAAVPMMTLVRPRSLTMLDRTAALLADFVPKLADATAPGGAPR